MTRPTPDDLIASDPPPAFPPWMVAADPRLAAQETNRIYQAFRRRRVWYPRAEGLFGGFRTWRRDWFKVDPSVMMGTLSISGFVLLVLFLSVWGCLLWVGLFLVASVISVTQRRPPSLFADLAKPRRLPRTVAEGFPAGGVAPSPAALEVAWTVAATGREVIDAIYLEAREADFWKIRIASAVCSLPGWMFFAFGLLAGRDSFLYWINSIPALLWLGLWGVVAWKGVAYNVPLSAVRRRVRAWQCYLPQHRGIRAPLAIWLERDGDNLMQRSVLFVILAGITLPTSGFFAYCLMQLVVSLTGIQGLETVSGITALILLLSVASFGFAAWLRKDSEIALIQLMEVEAPEAYEVMMSVLASGDDADSYRPPVAFHKEQRAIASRPGRPSPTTPPPTAGRSS